MKDKFPQLPPGTTPSDIDDHFGAPDPDHLRVIGDVTIAVDAIVPADATDREKREALREAFENGDYVQFLEAEVHEEEAEHGR